MKNIVILLLLGAAFSFTQCTSTTAKQSNAESTACCTKTKSEKSACCSKSEATENNTQNVANNDVIAYYFHATRRCATCQAVEKVTKEALQEFYGDKITLQSINRENENELTEKFNITGQSLLIVKGTKVVNLTNDAFLNARTNPDKLKSKIKATIDELI